MPCDISHSCLELLGWIRCVYRSGCRMQPRLPTSTESRVKGALRSETEHIVGEASKKLIDPSLCTADCNGARFPERCAGCGDSAGVEQLCSGAKQCHCQPYVHWRCVIGSSCDCIRVSSPVHISLSSYAAEHWWQVTQQVLDGHPELATVLIDCCRKLTGVGSGPTTTSQSQQMSVAGNGKYLCTVCHALSAPVQCLQPHVHLVIRALIQSELLQQTNCTDRIRIQTVLSSLARRWLQWFHIRADA